MLALLVAANAAEAQGGGGGGRGGRGGPGQITALMANITVDAAVQTKIDTLTAQFTAAQTKLRESLGMPAMGRGGGGGGGGTPPDSATMAKYQAGNLELTNKLRADVRALLNAEQQKTFDTNLANLPQGRGRRGGGE
jgi:hypothetical protein